MPPSWSWTARAPSTLALDVDQDPVPPGGDLRYRLTFGNRGVAPLAGGTARMAIPPGTSFVSASDDVTPQSGIVEWALGDLAAGASGTRDLVVHVDAVAGQILAAEATLDAGGAQTVAQHLARIEAVSALTVTLDAGPDPVGPGEPVLVSLTVTNRGLTHAAGRPGGCPHPAARLAPSIRRRQAARRAIWVRRSDATTSSAPDGRWAIWRPGRA